MPTAISTTFGFFHMAMSFPAVRMGSLRSTIEYERRPTGRSLPKKY